MSKILYNGEKIAEFMENGNLTYKDCINLALGIDENTTQDDLKELSKKYDCIYKDDNDTWCVDYDALTVID